MKLEMHSLLKRQVRKALADNQPLSGEMERLLEMVNLAYHQFDNDRKMLERSLELSSIELMEVNSQLRALFQTFPDVLLLVNPDGRIIDCRGQLMDVRLLDLNSLLGCHVVGSPLTQLFPDLATLYQETQRTGQINSLELFITPDKWFEVRLVPIHSIGVIFIIRDITPVKQGASALAEEKERLWVTIESINEGVISTDIHNRITLINKPAESVCGLSARELTGCSIIDILKIELEKGPPFPEIIQEISRGQRMDLSRYSPRLLRPDGGHLDLYFSGSPIFDPQNRIVGAVYIISDITHRRRIEEEILNMKKMESIGILAGGIAHDFNNLLAGILGNISLARLYAQKGKEIEDKLKSAEQASLRAQELTQQLLTFARGGVPVRSSESIADLLEESVQFLLRGSGIQVKCIFDEDLWPAYIDKGQINQVINNLIINASQAMPQGGTITIHSKNVTIGSDEMSALSCGEYICISVQDEGTGIAPEFLSRIFDPYFTTKKEGSGLGLTSSFHIVKRHGGLITVESESGRGAVFHVYLPASGHPAGTTQDVDEIPLGQGVVVIMDDDKMVQEVLEQQLLHLGYQVIAVENSQELVVLFDLGKERGLVFDLVILDLTIPGDIGGEVALKNIRTIQPTIRAVVSSGYSNNPVMADYQNYGFDGRVSKPFRISDLAQELRRVLTL